MFCFTGMTPEQVGNIIKDHSVYLTKVTESGIESPLFLTLFRTAASQWLELPLGMLAIWRKPCTMSPSNLLFINSVYCPPLFDPGFYLQSSSCLLYPQVNWTPALPESRSSLTAPLFKTISLLNIYQDHQLYSSMIKNGRAYLQAMKLLVIYLPWHCHGKFCCNTMCLKNKSLCDSFKIVMCEPSLGLVRTCMQHNACALSCFNDQ